MAVDVEDAALAVAQRYCGWPVQLVTNDDVVLDGPGGKTLSLPTLHLVELTAVTEDGVALDLADLRWSKLGLVRKRGFGWWSCGLGAIEVTMTHGYTDAPDFDYAVEQIAAAMVAAGLRDDPALLGKRVDDVEYNWSVTLLQQTGVSPAVEALLAPYRILVAA